jgi:lysine 6-dehydrogenase
MRFGTLDRQRATEMRILVLGCGMIGSAVALELARSQAHCVTVADIKSDRLAMCAGRQGIQQIERDLSDADEIASLATRHDLVVNALPGFLGYRALEAVIDAGRDVVDISFMPEDACTLDDLARQRGVTAIVDCGVAPGLSNMIAAAAAARLSPCQRIDIYVGGLPVTREPPYEYKAGFSPSDVIEEYVRPARVVENGRVIEKEALSGIELLDVPGVGGLEAFLTDGLRSLTRTLGVPFMQEKTLRYPGHAAVMATLRDGGFFSREPVIVGGVAFRPLDFTEAILFPRWLYREGEPDLTILRVVAQGHQNVECVELTWDLLDRYDLETGIRSMSRVTAFPAAIIADLVAHGAFPHGVHPPEAAGVMGMLDGIVAALGERGVHVCSNRRVLPDSMCSS